MSLHEYINFVIVPILGISTILVFVRLLIGPRLVDRVISLDMLILISVGIIAIYSIQFNQSTFIDIALLFGLIAFLATIAYAYYIEERGKRND